MRNKRILLVEWTDVIIRRVPVVVLASPPAAVIKHNPLSLTRRGNVGRVAWSAANSTRRIVRVLAHIS